VSLIFDTCQRHKSSTCQRLKTVVSTSEFVQILDTCHRHHPSTCQWHKTVASTFEFVRHWSLTHVTDTIHRHVPDTTVEDQKTQDTRIEYLRLSSCVTDLRHINMSMTQVLRIDDTRHSFRVSTSEFVCPSSSTLWHRHVNDTSVEDWQHKTLVATIYICIMCHWSSTLCCFGNLPVLQVFEGGNTLLPSATRCHTLRYDATHCKTLQRAATRCNIMQHYATQCRRSPLNKRLTRCNTLQHTTTHYDTLQHTATH